MRERDPHPEVHRLYQKRVAARRGDPASRFAGSVLRMLDMSGAAARRRAVFDIELEIHQAERTYGRQPYRFKRCAVCYKLHAATLTVCDGNGRMLFELWSAISPDLVVIVE